MFQPAADGRPIQHLAGVPAAVGIQGHELDEAERQVVLSSELAQRQNVFFVDAVDRQRVEPDFVEACLAGGRNPRQHAIQSGAAGDLLEGDFVQRVEADVDPPQAGSSQRLSLVGQQHPVGRQRQVVQLGKLAEHFHQPWQIVPHQRLAAGQAQLVDPQANGHGHKPSNLFERQQLGPRHVRCLLGRHAIHTPDVTAIRDADPQAAVPAAKTIEQG